MRRPLFHCDRAIRYLRSHSIRETPPNELTEHLSACASCREDWEEQTRVDRLLVSAPASPPSSEGAWESVIAAVRTEAPSRPSLPFATPIARRQALTALCVFAALFATRKLYYQRSAKPSIQPGISYATGKREPILAANPARSASPLLATAPRPKTEPSGNRDHPAVAKRGENGNAPSVLGGTAVAAKSGKREAPRIDDMAYLNDLKGEKRSASAARHPMKPLGDGYDFVTIPFPLLADADTTARGNRLIDDAVKSFEDEKAVVDPRLFKKIEVSLKGGDLKDFADALTQKSGVRIYVSDDLKDLKLSVFADRTPVRDLMRQVVRLFNLEWRRYGEDGNYRYNLVQTLKQKLSEEELKRKDDDQTLLNVVDDMEPYLQYKDSTSDQLTALAKEAEVQASVAGDALERQRLLDRQKLLVLLSSPKFKDTLRLYSTLTPDQLVSLRNGQDLNFSYKLDGSENSLPKDMGDALLQAFRDDPHLNEQVKDIDGKSVTLSMGFALNRNQPDQAGLSAKIGLDVKQGDHFRARSEISEDMVTGRPDRLRSPDNAKTHGDYRSQPGYAAKVTVAPDSSVPDANLKNPNAQQMIEDAKSKPGGETTPTDAKDWIDSADFFAALHKKTGKNLIADYYTRVYPKSLLSVAGESLLDALNGAGDALRSDWTEDGGFLRFRRFNYYTERTLDVPNRFLKKWEASRASRGYLDLDDLAEMANSSEVVLGNQPLQQAILLKYGLDEWPIVSGGKGILQFYATLSPDQRREIQSDVGLAVSEMSDASLASFKKQSNEENATADQIRAGRCYLALKRPGLYQWFSDDAKKPEDIPLRVIASSADRKEEEAAVENFFKNRGATPQKIEDAKGDIVGPEAALRLEGALGDRFFVVKTSGGGSSSWTGTFDNQGKSKDEAITRDSGR